MSSRLWLKRLVVMMICCATIMLVTQGFAAQKTIPAQTSSKSVTTTQEYDTPAVSNHGNQLADQIVVYKSKRLLYLMKDGHILRKYRVALGKNPMGNKMEWGDFRTPEGRYHIDLKNANSGYFRSMRISYPDTSDADVAAALDVKPGDWVMIHGMPNDRSASQMHHPDRDWTNGCIAVTNEEMTEIWNLVQVGTPISIWP